MLTRSPKPIKQPEIDLPEVMSDTDKQKNADVKPEGPTFRSAIVGIFKQFSRPEGPKASVLVGILTLGFVAIGMRCGANGISASGTTSWFFFGGFQLIALGALTVGFFTGFLFGIPRVVQGEAPSDALKSGKTYEQRVNTNLEQISDWLTKIIVGVGLVQMNSIPSFLWGISTRLSQAFSPDGAAKPTTVPAICSAIIFFSVLGLLSGYLLTRLYFASVFAEVDQRRTISRGYSSGEAVAEDALPASIKPVEKNLELGIDAKVIVATLAKYQEECFGADKHKRWTFLISPASPDYRSYLIGVAELLGHGLISVNPDNNHVMLSNSGLDYVSRFKESLGTDTYGPFAPEPQW